MLTTLSGRKALNALKPLMKSIFTLLNCSKIIVTMEKKTIMKSKMFQESLRYAFFAKKKPITTTLITHSAIKHQVMMLSNDLRVSFWNGSFKLGVSMASSNELSAIK